MQDTGASSPTPEEAFARRVKQLRTAAKMTQATLAQLVSRRTGNQIDDSAITRIERGGRMIRLNDAEAIAGVFSRSINDMLAPARSLAEEIAAAQADLEAAQQRERDASTAREAAESRLQDLQHKSDWVRGDYPDEGDEE